MQKNSLAKLFVAVAAFGTSLAYGDDEWLREGRNAGEPIFDLRPATEIHSFWYVQAPKINDAIRLLENHAILAISRDNASELIGHVPNISSGELLYLLRGIDVSDPIPLRVYQAENRIEVSAGTRSTCIIFQPRVRRQPIIAALSRTPEHLWLTYSCDG